MRNEERLDEELQRMYPSQRGAIEATKRDVIEEYQRD